MKTTAKFLIFVFLLASMNTPMLHAGDTRAAARSLILPGWGQYENGEFETKTGRSKGAAMAMLELGAILTTTIVGSIAGYPQIWIGVGIFIFNHVWSALDAFSHSKREPGIEFQTTVPYEKAYPVR